MERDIKPTYDELESYVENLQKQLADAQATIAALQAVIRQMGEQAAVLAKDGMAAKAQVAALQARVNELCKFRQADHEQLVEVQKYWRESQDEVHELRSQLTQRTVELKAAKDAAMYAGERLGAVLVERDTLQAELERVRERVGQRGLEVVMIGKVGHYVSTAVKEELERVRGERDHAKKMEAVQKEVADNQTWHVQKLRTLILALPKVEGEIQVIEAATDEWHVYDAIFTTQAGADNYAAMLQERQKLC